MYFLCDHKNASNILEPQMPEKGDAKNKKKNHGGALNLGDSNSDHKGETCNRATWYDCEIDFSQLRS